MSESLRTYWPLAAAVLCAAGLAVIIRRRRWVLRRLPAWLLVSVSRAGVEFPHYGDEVIWTWPWRHKAERLRGPWISLGFSGNGEFGDARYRTLADLRRSWDEYFECERKIADSFAEHFGQPPGTIPPFDPRVKR